MKGPRYPDQIVCEVGEDAPVVLFVSIGQQAFAVSELGECHRQILIPTRKTPAMMITIVAGYTFLKFLVRKMRDQFRNHEAAGVHPPLSIWAADGSPAALMRCSRRCRSSPGESPTTTRLFFERR